jgi:hypothetical protein
MENDMAKQLLPNPFAKSEAEQEIERLKEQVRHAEVHGGQTDTCHHEMLKRALEAPKE